MSGAPSTRFFSISLRMSVSSSFWRIWCTFSAFSLSPDIRWQITWWSVFSYSDCLRGISNIFRNVGGLVWLEYASLDFMYHLLWKWDTTNYENWKKMGWSQVVFWFLGVFRMWRAQKWLNKEHFRSEIENFRVFKNIMYLIWNHAEPTGNWKNGNKFSRNGRKIQFQNGNVKQFWWFWIWKMNSNSAKSMARLINFIFQK